MEKEPKHNVMQDNVIPLIVIYGPATFVCGALVFSTIRYGLVVMMFAYAGFSVLALEVFHCLFDR